MKPEVTVAASIGWLKTALTSVLVATPVTAGMLAAGDVELTAGWVPMPGAPRIGSMPLPQAASSSVSSAAVQQRSAPGGWDGWVMAVCALLVLADARERTKGPDDRDGAGVPDNEGKWHLRK